MNWKFWQKTQAFRVASMREEMEREEAAVWAEMEAEKKAKAKAEWDALPDHRKAARIEYKFFQAMARPKIAASYRAASETQQDYWNRMAFEQMAAMQNSYVGSMPGGVGGLYSGRQGAQFGSNIFG